MPLLVIEAKGEIISSNFDAFAAAVRDRLAEFNLALQTDDDFDQAAEDAKVLKQCEDDLKAAKAKALEKAESLNALFAGMDDLTGEIAAARLNLSRQIDKRKVERKSEIINSAMDRLICDPSMRLGYRSRIEAATKSRRSFAAMEAAAMEAVDGMNFDIARARNMLDEFEAAHGRQLTLDRRNLEVTNPDALPSELTRRREAAESEARERKAREEALKAQQEAQRQEALARQAWAEVERQKASQDAPTPVLAPTPAETAKTPPAQPQAAKTPEFWEPDGLEEWRGFIAAVRAAFAPLKAARAALTYEANINDAAIFAQAVATAWEGLRK